MLYYLGRFEMKDSPPQVLLEQKYLQKQGWTLLFSAVAHYQLQFRLECVTRNKFNNACFAIV